MCEVINKSSFSHLIKGQNRPVYTVLLLQLCLASCGMSRIQVVLPVKSIELHAQAKLAAIRSPVRRCGYDRVVAWAVSLSFTTLLQ